MSILHSIKKTDADILEKLDHVESKMGYIKKLIRDDIEKAKKDQSNDMMISQQTV